METETNNNKSNMSNSLEKEGRNLAKEKSKSNSNFKFVKTNLYLNDYNYYYRNAIKMNKIREEKLKEIKMKNEIERKKNLLPKMLYFNKFLNVNEKVYKPIERKENLNQTNVTNSVKVQNTEGQDSFQEIESAIMAKNIEDNSRSHIKKTIRKFDDLLNYVDTFKFKNKSKSSPKFIINEDEKTKLNIVLNSEGNIENEDNNDEEDDDILKTENYNFDEFRNQFKKNKISKKEEGNIPAPLKTYNSQVILPNKSSDSPKNIKDNIYLTKVNKNPNNNSQDNLPNILDLKNISNIIEDNNNIMSKSNGLKINNMNLISDDLLVNKIKNEGRDYKNGLYFNNYGKYKYTDLGLSYPEFVDKYKKIPDYKGNDYEEKKQFKYHTDIANPKYNYYNIGTFNEIFNKDLYDISSYYGKERSKGRFIKNPLISTYRRNIPNYDQYKNIKVIENRYNVKNKYRFRLKPLVNSKKNNFDRFGRYVFRREKTTNFLQ